MGARGRILFREDKHETVFRRARVLPRRAPVQDLPSCLMKYKNTPIRTPGSSLFREVMHFHDSGKKKDII